MFTKRAQSELPDGRRWDVFYMSFLPNWFRFVTGKQESGQCFVTVGGAPHSEQGLQQVSI